MVEDIEKVSPKLEVLGLCDVRALQNRDVKIIDSRATALGALGITEGTKQSGVETAKPGIGSARRNGIVRSILGKAVRVEAIATVLARVLGVKRRKLSRFAGQFEIKAIHQFIVRGRSDANGETALEADDP